MKLEIISLYLTRGQCRLKYKSIHFRINLNTCEPPFNAGKYYMPPWREREREKEIKELSQSRPGIEEGSSHSSLQSIRKEMRSCGIVLEAKPGLGDAI